MVGRSVSQSVLVSSTLVGLATRYYFLSECCCLKFAVLFLWAGSKVEVDVRSYFTTDGQSVSMSRYRAHSGTCDQILLSVRRLFSESCCLVSVEVTLRLTVSQYVLISSTLVGLATRYYFLLSENCGLVSVRRPL
jgi:hypothetical protein